MNDLFIAKAFFGLCLIAFLFWGRARKRKEREREKAMFRERLEKQVGGAK